jgi:uncharacterized repeat protein (TIGR03803 family)
MRKAHGRSAAATIAVISLVLATAMAAQNFTVVFNFTAHSGFFPMSSLIQGTDGYLYGTTYEGGAYGGGTLFKVGPIGNFTPIHSFCAQTGCPDGNKPASSLVLATDGNFYGTTFIGGAKGAGTIFSITPDGALTTLYTFTGKADGALPSALVLGSNGNFYGATVSGGALHAGCGGYGCGTIFAVTPKGALTTLHTFEFTDGGAPVVAGLIQAGDGNFYGATTDGGVGCHVGCGTIFRVSPSGAFATLHKFVGNDGSNPLGALLQASDGNLYGTTQVGGIGNEGTIFRMTLEGSFTTLHEFAGPDGSQPYAALIQATDGNFYGTTRFGGSGGSSCGSLGCGTVFQMTPAGALKTLHSFVGSDGDYPDSAVFQATTGNLYSMTTGGGPYAGYGTIFGLALGLGPFLEAVPTSGKAGQSVMILATDLTGPTSVSFNGTPATFQVVSGSLISTTVPAGATTGPVQVVTPRGTLSGNVNFQVLP